MKLNKFLIGLGALATLSLAACSNDEPINNTEPEKPVQGEGSNFYLNVNIIDANASLSRADGDDTPATDKDPDYIYGDGNEHNVNRADFLFYDANKRFLARANVWNGGKEDKEDVNIEYMGKNTLVLRNLTEKNLPKYVITVLNAPKIGKDDSNPGVDLDVYVESNNLNMDQTRKLLIGIGTPGNFVMTTTSFHGKPVDAALATEAERYDDGAHYYTILDPYDFMKEEPTPDDIEKPENKNKIVKIYVERVAAKFSLDINNRKFPVKVTIAGKPNSGGNVENDRLPSANETVYVEILGYGLTCQEDSSYLSKNIDGFVATSLWNTWNHPDYFRSYWAKSPNYVEPGEETTKTPNLKIRNFREAMNDPTMPIYGYETTQIGGNKNISISKNFTHLAITARLYSDEAGNNPIDLVEYNGVYFTKEQFINYVLTTLSSNGKLQYWKNETVTTDSDGNKTYKYEGLAASDFDWVKANNNAGEIFIHLKSDPNINIYTKGEGYKEGGQLQEATAEEINAELEAFNPQSPAIAFNQGNMYYTIPVQHLRQPGQEGTLFADQLEGVYGVVRNHWYKTKVNKVITLGHGVYNPGTEDGKDPGEPIIPDDPDKESFALAAQINVLSWRIVSQSIDI